MRIKCLSQLGTRVNIKQPTWSNGSGLSTYLHKYMVIGLIFRPWTQLFSSCSEYQSQICHQPEIVKYCYYITTGIVWTRPDSNCQEKRFTNKLSLLWHNILNGLDLMATARRISIPISRPKFPSSKLSRCKTWVEMWSYIHQKQNLHKYSSHKLACSPVE